MPAEIRAHVIISIHVLREEDDDNPKGTYIIGTDFNPRPPRGGRQNQIVVPMSEQEFQSTSSARRTTRLLPQVHDRAAYFNPRPPRGGRLTPTTTLQTGITISIHVLREEDDLSFARLRIVALVFQSTSSARRTTAVGGAVAPGARDFNPRPPRGGRQQKYTKNLCIFCAKGAIISPPGGVIRCIAAKRKLQHSTV